jgi:hypothetical protein
MEIDLLNDPPSTKEIEAERLEIENSRLLIVQNEAHVANLYHKLLIKAVIIAVILVIVAILYFILPDGIFGMVNGRTIILVTVGMMLIASLGWIAWRTWQDARSIVPNRNFSKEQMLRLKSRVVALADIDVKLRLNVVTWSRADGILTEYIKKITRQRRHLIGLEYQAIKNHIETKTSH